MSANFDTKAAFKEKWDQDDELPDLVPGGLHADRAPASPPAELKLPYAVIKCEQGPTANQHYAPAGPGQAFLDYRHVLIEVYGSDQEAVAVIMTKMRERFDWKPLTVPNASFKRCMPLDEDEDLAPDATTKDGQDVWMGQLGWEVMTQRTTP